jgi:hypothetical protein
MERAESFRDLAVSQSVSDPFDLFCGNRPACVRARTAEYFTHRSPSTDYRLPLTDYRSPAPVIGNRWPVIGERTTDSLASNNPRNCT